MNGLVGYSLIDMKMLATLGATTYVLGSALSTMPMSLWMARVGRRRGFMAGALINIGGCALAVLALSLHSFALYCVATAVIGIYNAVGLQYRFAATEVAAKADKARAISLVLAGGIAGGFLGPAITRWGKDLFAAPFLGSFMLLAAVALVALAVQSRVDVPKPTARRALGRRPAVARDRAPAGVHRRRAFRRAGLRADEPADDGDAAGDGLLQPSLSAAAFVISWHVVGMYAPGFVTGSLIARFGVLRDHRRGRRR